MKLFRPLLFIFLMVTMVTAEEFGIYEKVIEKAEGSPSQLAAKIAEAIDASALQLLNKMQVNTPNLVRENKQKHSPFGAFLILATDANFNKTIAALGNRYAANWLLRVGIFEDENGTHVAIANPITLARIICNDLPDDQYNQAITAAEEVSRKLRAVIVPAIAGKEVRLQMPPLRSAKRLRKAKKDMMMMVGPMTFFRDKDQFPILIEVDAGANPTAKLKEVIDLVKKNISSFKPTEKDAGYHWTNNSSDDLKWRIVCEVQAEGINAALIGITRNRTEALSFHICGMKRESDANSIPGIDHVCAYPVEVAIYEEDGKIKVGTPREMFRMDMFFWDAGKWAFMKFMNMPSILDKSIKKAVTGKTD